MVWLFVTRLKRTNEGFSVGWAVFTLKLTQVLNWIHTIIWLIGALLSRANANRISIFSTASIILMHVGATFICTAVMLFPFTPAVSRLLLCDAWHLYLDFVLWNPWGRIRWAYQIPDLRRRIIRTLCVGLPIRREIFLSTNFPLMVTIDVMTAEYYSISSASRAASSSHAWKTRLTSAMTSAPDRHFIIVCIVSKRRIIAAVVNYTLSF